MGYINENCIYKILPKINLDKAIQVDKSKMKPFLFNKSNTDRSTTADDIQNWYFIFHEKYQSYKIVNVETNKMLGYENDNSQNILMEDLSVDSLYCHWIIQVTNDGCVVIRNAGDRSRVLDVSDSRGVNGTQIILYKETDRKNQRFKLVRYKFKKGFKYTEAKKLEKPHVQEENTYKNIDDLLYKVFSSEQFTKKWANVADMLGFKYCSGTRGINIGEDFNIKKQNGKYILTANYRSGDPFVYGVGPSHRLVMEISNIRLTFDPSSIKAGKPSIRNLNPTVISSTNAVNHGKAEATVGTEIEYTTGHTVSNSTSNTIANSVSIENSFKLKIQGFKFEESFTYTFAHEKTWGQQVDKSIETKVKSIYSTTVPAGGSVPIYALLYQSKANIPYKAVAHLEYEIRLIGFLKDDNALRGKHNNNQKTAYSFGNRNISAPEALLDEYTERDVKGSTSGWDYTWCILNYEPEYFNKYMSEAITQDEVEISGIFTNISSTNVTIVSGKRPNEEGTKILEQQDINVKDPDMNDEDCIEIEVEKV